MRYMAQSHSLQHEIYAYIYIYWCLWETQNFSFLLWGWKNREVNHLKDFDEHKSRAFPSLKAESLKNEKPYSPGRIQTSGIGWKNSDSQASEKDHWMSSRKMASGHVPLKITLVLLTPFTKHQCYFRVHFFVLDFITPLPIFQIGKRQMYKSRIGIN